MTESEALDILIRFRCFHVDGPRSEAMEVAIKALDKQIAKEPKIKPNRNWKGTDINCPTCGNYLMSNYTSKFCDCGQRIKWN